MRFLNLNRSLARRARTPSRSRCVLTLEPLEARWCPSGVLFDPADNYAVGASPTGVAVGDFNGDGKPDLAVANYGANTVSVLLNNRAGGFGLAVNYPTSYVPIFIAVRDFNGDGKLDLAVANFGGKSVSVLLGDGAGGFAPAVNFEVGYNPASIAVGDFNGDGKLDLATANLESASVSVLLGDGAGGFQPAIDSPAGYLPVSVAAGDFNGDGKLDLAVAQANTSFVNVLMGNGSGGFARAVNVPAGGPYDVVVADFNGDGKADLAVADPNGGGTVGVLLGTGAGGFAPVANFPVGDAPLSLAVGDFNGDGRPDVAVANFGSNNVSVLLGNGDGGFAPAVNFPVGNHPESVAVGDFNGDSCTDLAVANGYSDTVSVLLNSAVGIAINDVIVARPNAGTAYTAFTVRLSKPSDTTLVLNYHTANGTAAAGADYQGAFGSLTFVPGQISQTIIVPVLGSNLADGNKTFSVVIGDASDGIITDGQATGTILSDLITASGRPLAAGAGKKFSGVVGSFTATNFTAAGDFSVFVDWGDGTTSAGTVVFDTATGQWDIVGSHKYGKQGTYAVRFVITNANGKTGTATSTLTT
jgi:hypothetical protein